MAAKSKKTEVREEATVVNFESNAIDKLFFADVKKVSSHEIMPGMSFCDYNSHAIIVTDENGNKKVVNHVSEGYLLLPNNDIFPKLEDNLKSFGNVDINREVKNNSQFFVDYKFMSSKNAHSLVDNDLLFPRITIQNSYNSRNVYNIQAGLYREVCSNGMAVPESEITDFTISHCVGNLEIIIEQTLDIIQSFLGNQTEIIQSFEPLMERKLKASDIEDAVEEVLTSTRCLLSFKEEIIDRIMKENKENNIELNLFSLYNGINYVLQPNNNPKMTSSHDIRQKCDKKVLDYIMSMVG